MGIRCADHVTHLYPQKLALTSPTGGGGRSVGIVRSRTKATEFVCLLYVRMYVCMCVCMYVSRSALVGYCTDCRNIHITNNTNYLYSVGISRRMTAEGVFDILKEI